MSQLSFFNLAQFTSVILEDDSCECSNCSDSIATDNAITVNNDPYCGDCVSYCECCDSDTVDDLTTVYTREYSRYPENYCENCVDDNTFKCSDCCDYFSDNLAQYEIQDTSETVCSGCYDNGSYFYCEDCGYYYSDNQYNSVDNGGACDDCYRDHYSNKYIKNYNTNPLDYLEFLGSPNDGLFLGLELEVYASGNLSDTAENVAILLEDYAILKEDGSINKPGFEIVSAPCSLDIHRRKLTEFFDNDPDINSGSGMDIGLHIHISRRPLSQLTIGKLLVFVNNPDNYNIITKLSGRCSEQWAKLSPKKVTDVKKQVSRYEAVNLQNDSTVEFRIFGSTCNVDLILARLEFVHCVVSWAQCESMLSLSWLSFKNYARDNVRLYPRLVNWLENN
jgi:hypothetical protein